MKKRLTVIIGLQKATILYDVPCTCVFRSNCQNFVVHNHDSDYWSSSLVSISAQLGAWILKNCSELFRTLVHWEFVVQIPPQTQAVFRCVRASRHFSVSFVRRAIKMEILFARAICRKRKSHFAGHLSQRFATAGRPHYFSARIDTLEEGTAANRLRRNESYRHIFRSHSR